MKILAICGSPRKGNAEFMLNIILDEYKNNGNETEIIFLRDKKIEHCRGCLSCAKSNECIINDDMAEINKKLLESDIIILGTPNYFDNVPGLVKDFIDRTNPFYETDVLKDKKVIALVSGGGETKNSERVIQQAIMHFTDAHKMKLENSLCIQSLKPDEVSKNNEIIKKLKTMAK